MQTSLTPDALQGLLAQLAEANRASARGDLGESADRQPVHTVYGGAHLFTAGTAQKLGAAALRSLEVYAPDPEGFARAIGLAEPLAAAVYARVVAKLEREPIED